MNQENLNRCAEIIRIYDLGNIHYFMRLFPNEDKFKKIRAWKFWHNNIIRNSRRLSYSEILEVKKRVKLFGEDYLRITNYLYSDFNANTLKKRDEKIERRVRNKLARKYVKHLSSQERKILDGVIVENIFFAVIVCSLGILFFSPRIIEGLSPPEKIAKELYEESSYNVRIGAKCMDGRNSNATGRGACSHHGGVREWKYEKKYRKSYRECEIEALEISWIE